MSAIVILATSDSALADVWEAQLPSGRVVLRLAQDMLVNPINVSSSVVVVLDVAAKNVIPQSFMQAVMIVVGEPLTHGYEQLRLAKQGKVFLSYEESLSRISGVFPLVEEIAEKDAMVRMLSDKVKRTDAVRTVYRDVAADPGELWDFLEGAIENLDARDRLITEFRRASRHLLRASHVVFFLREADGFRADRGTSFVPIEDPLIGYLESHPAVIDGTTWEGPADPVAELAVRNRLALWGSRLLVPVHDNGRLLGIIALGIRNDGQRYDESDRNKAVFFARLLRNLLVKTAQFGRISHVAGQVALGARYLPGTIVLGPDESAPRHVPVVVRDLVGQVRRAREVVRVAPCVGQPFRASAGIIAETGGVWASWEEASWEVHDAVARGRSERREMMREIALTLSHELGNALVSLATFRQTSPSRAIPASLVESIKADISQLETLNSNLAVMQSLHEVEPTDLDVREMARGVCEKLGVRVDLGPDPIIIRACQGLLEYALNGILRTIKENRKERELEGVALRVRSTGTAAEITGLLAIRGEGIELEGILPEADLESVPNQGRMSVFIAKEILRLHNGEIHSGPGMDSIEILISIRSV